MYIASFDIGKKNFAFCIEFFREDSLLQMKKLDDIPLEGKVILFENIDLTKNKKKCSYRDILIEMNNVLDQYKLWWDNCQYILIEQQVSFGKKVNPMALKLGQHCQSYFLFQYGIFKEIIEFPSYHKTRVFNAPKMTKYYRKKWAVQKTKELLQFREEYDHLELISSTKKADDYSDTFLQIQAFKILKYIFNKF